MNDIDLWSLDLYTSHLVFYTKPNLFDLNEMVLVLKCDKKQITFCNGISVPTKLPHKDFYTLYVELNRFMPSNRRLTQFRELIVNMRKHFPSIKLYPSHS